MPKNGHTKVEKENRLKDKTYRKEGIDVQEVSVLRVIETNKQHIPSPQKII